MRTGTYRVAALTLIGAVLSPALAALSTFSIPSDELSWKDAQQDPLSDALHLEVLDFERFDDGIVPIQPSLTIAVPAIPLDVVDEDLSQEDLDALFDFSQNVAQRDVVALERVVLEPESRTIEAGQVLIPRWGTFPRRAREVQIRTRSARAAPARAAPGMLRRETTMLPLEASARLLAEL